MRGYGFGLPMLASLAGCGTIDQVPLAYVSTVKVGISAESATAQVPGGKVMIGVEATDAALVPVAIGRTCSGSVGKACDPATAPITLVNGNNDFSPATYLKIAEARADAIRAASDAIRHAETELGAAARETVKRQALDDQAKAATRLLATLQGEAAAERQRLAAGGIAAIDPGADQRAKDRDAEIGQVQAQIAAQGDTAAPLALARQSEAAAQARLGQAYADFDARQTALRDALAQHPPASGTRQDALSVFGSFNADGSGTVEKTGAGLKLGKSFSTGVAAQLLTEGLSRAAARNAAAACLAAAVEAGAAGSPDRHDAIALCTASSRDPGT